MDKYWCWDANDGRDDGPIPDDAYEVEVETVEDAALAFARYSWEERGGWEWMHTGTVFNVSTGNHIYRIEIEVEHQPVFYSKTIH